METTDDIEELTALSDVRNGKKDGLKVLYEAKAGALLVMISLMVDNDYARYRILERTFMMVWKNPYQFNASKDTLFTWLLRIAIAETARYLNTDLIECEIKLWTDFIEVERLN